MSTNQTASDNIRFLKHLRAVRAFRPGTVPEAALKDILDVARWSGSASNRQPWELVVVQDREMLQALVNGEGSIKHVGSAAMAIILVMAGDPDRFPHETYDEGRLSERIMLAAAAHGLGSCIGWFKGNAPSEVKEMLGIPADRLVRTVISIGYPDEEARRAQPKRPQPRKPIAEIVHRERFA